MSNASILSGTVSHLSSTTTVHGSVKRGKGNVRTSHKTDFRVDGKPAYFRNSVNLADGDRVTLAGKFKGGEFFARALKNDQTNVIYSEPTTLYFFLGVLFLVIGIPFVMILIGILIIPIAAYLLWEGWQNFSAVKALHSASITPVAA